MAATATSLNKPSSTAYFLQQGPALDSSVLTDSGHHPETSGAPTRGGSGGTPGTRALPPRLCLGPSLLR